MRVPDEGRATRAASRLSGQVLRLRRPARGPVTITVDGIAVRCFEGETISTAILALRSWIGSDGKRAHGLWCGIGVCFECVVTVDGVAGVRACMTPVRPGMEVVTALRRATETAE